MARAPADRAVARHLLAAEALVGQPLQLRRHRPGRRAGDQPLDAHRREGRPQAAVPAARRPSSAQVAVGKL